MSTATASDNTVPLLGGRYHFMLRRLHSLTGILFGGYLFVHLLVNATIAQMGTVYQVQVQKIHDLPFLWAIEWTAIYLPILYHTAYGLWITFTGQPNVASYPYQKNWYYLLQRISAIILVLFIAFHVLSLKYGLLGAKLAFDPHQALTTVHEHLSAYAWIAFIVYPIGILAACFHVANGFWTAAVTWGLTVSAGAQRRWGIVCGILFGALLILGMVALIAGYRLTPPPPGAPVQPVHMP